MARLQFTIRDMLVLTFVVAAALSCLRAFGPDAAPCVSAAAVAAFGYWLTSELERRSLYDVMVAFYLGALGSMVAHGWRYWRTLWPPDWYWQESAPLLAVAAIVAGAVATWRFDRRDRRSPIVAEATTDWRLSRMLRYRRAVLIAGFLLVMSFALALLNNQPGFPHFQPFSYVVGLAMGAIFTCMLGAVAAIAYYVFRIGLTERGRVYAVGHVVLCVLFFFLCVVGVALVPTLVLYDVQRWRRAESGGDPNDSDAPDPM
jgi:hypothetical protein